MINRDEILEILVIIGGYLGKVMVWVGLISGCIMLWYFVFTLLIK